jgi:hypothetical protein
MMGTVAPFRFDYAISRVEALIGEVGVAINIEDGKAASKSKNLAIFFLCHSKHAVSFKIQLLEYFPQKQKEQRHKPLGYTNNLVTTEI